MRPESIKHALDQADNYPKSQNVTRFAKKVRLLLKSGYSIDGYSVASATKSLVWALSDAEAVSQAWTHAHKTL